MQQSNRYKLSSLYSEREKVINAKTHLLTYSMNHVLSEKAQHWLDDYDEYLKQINFEITRLKAITI